MVYDCVICWGVNDAKRLHCQHCGCIPEQYSPTGKLMIEKTDDGRLIDFVSAWGASHVESHRSRRLNFRTVPLDYFVSE